MPISGPDIILYEKKDKIVTITLNRPERMNSITEESMFRLMELWKRFDEDEDAWVAIVTAVGDKMFCPGQDLIEMKENTEKKIPYKKPRFYYSGTWKPTICAINGTAIAGGWAIAQSCDIRIASEKAEFGIAETRWNMPAGWVYSVPKFINLGLALEIILWGDTKISAQRAYEIGWLNRVVPQEKVMEEAMAWAERMLYLGPRCVRNLKEILHRCPYMVPEEAEAFYRALEANLENMQDTFEARRAFAEKRKPIFHNR